MAVLVDVIGETLTTQLPQAVAVEQSGSAVQPVNAKLGKVLVKLTVTETDQAAGVDLITMKVLAYKK